MSCATVRMRRTRRMCSGSCQCHSRLFLLDIFISFLTFFPAPGITTLCPSLYWPRYFLNPYINSSISQSNRKLSLFSWVLGGGFIGWRLLSAENWSQMGVCGRRGKRKMEPWIPYFTEQALVSMLQFLKLQPQYLLVTLT